MNPLRMKFGESLMEHIVLDRYLASHGHYPAIDVLRSISRVMPSIVTHDQLEAASHVRSLISAYDQKRDLILLGGYAGGTDSRLDRAVAARSDIDGFLRQSGTEHSEFDETWSKLVQLAKRFS